MSDYKIDTVKLRLARQAKFGKQSVAAAALGVEMCTVSSWERGFRVPSMKHILKLVEMYGWKSIDDIVIRNGRIPVSREVPRKRVVAPVKS